MPMRGLTAENQCVARAKMTGEQCKLPRVTGFRVCEKHGAGGDKHRERANMIKAERKLAKFVRPIDASDPEANVIYGFEVEYRRCVARIRYYDDRIVALDSERDLIWGVTKEEDINATEFGGFDTTYEAKRSMWLQLQDDERHTLREIAKIWIAAKLDIRKLEIEENKLDAIDNAITRILTRMGVQVHTVEARAVIREELLAINKMPVLESEKRR